jgi:DNA-binding IclR family transcriptional regulator
VTERETQSDKGTALDKAIGVLGSLESVRNGLALAEIARTVDLPKPTVHRILATLERHGYVQQLANGKYALGLRIISLGLFAAANNSLVSAAQPVLDRLVFQCAETVHLGVLQEAGLMYVDRREPEDAAVRVATLPSPMTSLHASACGKVLLAFSDDEVLEGVLSAGLTRYNENTITDEGRLRDELAVVRQRKYAVNEQERFIGVRAVAVPVFNRRGSVVAGLSIAGPIQRIDKAKLAELTTLLSKAANELAMAIALRVPPASAEALWRISKLRVSFFD